MDIIRIISGGSLAWRFLRSISDGEARMEDTSLPVEKLRETAEAFLHKINRPDLIDHLDFLSKTDLVVVLQHLLMQIQGQEIPDELQIKVREIWKKRKNSK